MGSHFSVRTHLSGPRETWITQVKWRICSYQFNIWYAVVKAVSRSVGRYPGMLVRSPTRPLNSLTLLHECPYAARQAAESKRAVDLLVVGN